MKVANEQLGKLRKSFEAEKVALDDHILEQKDKLKRLNQEVIRLIAEAKTTVNANLCISLTFHSGVEYPILIRIQK